MRRPAVIMVALLLMLSVGAAGCGKSGSGGSAATSGAAPAAQTTANGSSGGGKVRLAKTKFLLHAGLAFGAFHRYIYKPFKNHTLTSAGRLKKAAIIAKAGLAGLFAYHELKLAMTDARSSPLLSKLLTPLTALASRLQSLGSSLRRGHVDPAAIQQANGEVAALSGQSSRLGAAIQDVTPPANLQPTG